MERVASGPFLSSFWIGRLHPKALAACGPQPRARQCSWLSFWLGLTDGQNVFCHERERSFFSWTISLFPSSLVIAVSPLDVRYLTGAKSRRTGTPLLCTILLLYTAPLPWVGVRPTMRALSVSWAVRFPAIHRLPSCEARLCSAGCLACHSHPAVRTANQMWRGRSVHYENCSGTARHIRAPQKIALYTTKQNNRKRSFCPVNGKIRDLVDTN